MVSEFLGIGCPVDPGAGFPWQLRLPLLLAPLYPFAWPEHLPLSAEGTSHWALASLAETLGSASDSE